MPPGYPRQGKAIGPKYSANSEPIEKKARGRIDEHAKCVVVNIVIFQKHRELCLSSSFDKIFF
jgi:hypothetical protein